MASHVPSFRGPQRAIVAGFRVSAQTVEEKYFVHYLAYLDEFGHIGPFVSRNHPKFNDSPVFGLAGFLLPVEAVREFAIYFYQLKCRLLAWDLQHKNPGHLPPYQWEKKGSAVYTATNVEKYRELRTATNRMLNRIAKDGGYLFYTGEHKTTSPEAHDSAETYKRQLLQAIRKIDRFCNKSGATFMLLLDEQDAGDEWRERNVEACTLSMFEDSDEKCRSLVEPPVQGESHLYQTLQCADWICGLVGRLMAFETAPQQYGDWQLFDRYFGERTKQVMLPSSGLEHQKHSPLPVELAGEVLPDAPGNLA